MPDVTINKAIAKILSDIRVELSQEFDKNFQRQGFFTEAWQRHKTPLSKGSILTGTGDLRRSIRTVSDQKSITFISDLPYAAIHNEGGEIKVTQRMKSYFWHRYYEAVGRLEHKKDGGMRRTKKNASLNADAEVWKHMALMRVGAVIKIPKRRFLGESPEVRRICEDTISRNLEEYFSEFGSEKAKQINKEVK
jgi:phage gpG-like protein